LLDVCAEVLPVVVCLALRDVGSTVDMLA